jgi:hypothetical protein
MSPAPTLYSIAPSSAAGELTVTQVWQQDGDGPLPSGCAQIRQLAAGDSSYLVCASGSGGASAARVGSSPPYVEPAQSSLAIEGPWDALEPFVLGNAPYLLAYDAKSGEISVYPVGDALATSTPYQFFRKRPPAISIGFDMITPVVVLGSLYLLGYIKKTGDVRAYSLSVTATNPPSAPGTPPLLALPVWDHQWAPDWTRFAFFYLGGEVFFFKVNDGKLNVNIDHLNDNPALGTVEVGSYLQAQLPDALDIDLARAFYLSGDPHLLMYKNDGSTDLYRVRGDCQGWTKLAGLTTVEGATEVVPYQVADQTFVLFY